MMPNRRTFLRVIGAGSIGATTTMLTSGVAAAATTITIEGGGADIWDTADAFHFYYDSTNGDFDVTVHNTELEWTDANAKTGLMVRPTLDPDAKNVMLRRTPNGDASLQWRPESGVETLSTTSGGEDKSEVDGGSISAEWLRLTRTGDTISAYGSSDGSDWTRIAQLTADDVDLPAQAYVGIPVTSHSPGTLCTARLRDLSGISPDAHRDVGSVEVSGSVSVEEGVPYVSTEPVTDVRATSATLNAELTDLGGAESASCYFEYREVPTERWKRTDSRQLSSSGSFSIELSRLTSRRYYQVRAVVNTSDGDSFTSPPFTFGTPSFSRGDGGQWDGPRSKSHFEPDDGFADPAPWLNDDTPIIKITKPTRRQLETALNVDGPRVVVFETSGTIDLHAERLTVSNDQLYLAGQTAPSPGITLIRGDLWVVANDCVIQHLRVRPGDAGQDVGWEPDGINTGDGTENNVIDHCTTTWSVDENLSVGYDTNDTTMSNCLVAEALRDATHHKGEHNYGSLIGNGAENVAMMGNLWADNIDRNPRLKEGTRSVVVNNLVFHFKDGAWLDPDTQASIEGNVYRHPINDKPKIFGDGEAYIHDNDLKSDAPGELVGDGITVLDERPLWPEGLDPLSSDDTVRHNFRNVGARPGDRTEHDKRILRKVARGEGQYIDSQEEVGGYPELPENTHHVWVPQCNTRAWLRMWAWLVE